MKRPTSLVTTLALVAGVSVAQARDLEIIDTDKFAKAVGDKIVELCKTAGDKPTEAEATSCISGTVGVTYTVSTKLAEEISARLKDKKIGGFDAGLAHGDLLRFCEGTLKATGGKKYPTLKLYADAAFAAVKECVESMHRSGAQVGINFQPTARNTIANHMNCLTGRECQRGGSISVPELKQ